MSDNKIHEKLYDASVAGDILEFLVDIALKSLFVGTVVSFCHR